MPIDRCQTLITELVFCPGVGTVQSLYRSVCLASASAGLHLRAWDGLFAPPRDQRPRTQLVNEGLEPAITILLWASPLQSSAAPRSFLPPHTPPSLYGLNFISKCTLSVCVVNYRIASELNSFAIGSEWQALQSSRQHHHEEFLYN